MFLHSKRIEKAEKALRRFTGRVPGYSKGHELFAKVLLKLNRQGDAANEYTLAIALNPKPELYINRAKILAGIKKFERIR